MTDPEADFAIHLANRALADTSRDPDSDLSVLARQLLRCHERISEAGEMIVVEAARSALFGIELARVIHHQPSGGIDYFTVEFAGSKIVFKAPFQDEDVDCIRGPLGPEMATLSDKATKCATAINDLLFDVAKKAAEKALAASPSGPQTALTTLTPPTRREKEVRESLDRLADRLGDAQ
jgi:hypothetical protein